MNTDKEIKKLERQIASLRAKSHRQEARRKKTALRKVIAVVRNFGFDSIHELLEIADTAVVAVSTKRKRAKITAAIRKKVEKMLRNGLTVKAVAEKAGISAPSVNIIKARAGLTKSRKSAKAAKTPKKKAGKVRPAQSLLRPRAVKGPKAKAPRAKVSPAVAPSPAEAAPATV